MTPRKLSAYFYLIRKRVKIEHAENLGLMAVAFHTDGKSLKKSIEQLIKE